MRDLFGDEPPRAGNSNDLVRVALTAFADRETPAAWFLSKTGNRAHGKFAPKSKVARGVGPDINVFTMPRWLAREKAWL